MIRSISKEEAESFGFANEQEAITYQMVHRLIAAPGALCLSDGKDVLFARGSILFPGWVYAARSVSDEGLSELAASLCVLRETKNLSGVIGLSRVVRYLELALPFPKKRRMPLTAYLIGKPRPFTIEGARVPAKDLDPAVCGNLLAQLAEQAHEPIPEGERLAAGQRFCANPDAYGWCINGTTVSLVSIAHRANGVAHVNSVVTDERQRGHGYAKALVSSVCADEFANGGRTMLYADTTYPSSNALYRAVGFTEVGRLIGFDFVE